MDEEEPPAEIVTRDIRVAGEINKVRSRDHLEPLRHDEALSTLAEAHAMDMAERWYYDTVTPEGKSPRDQLTDAGLQPEYYGMVICAGRLLVAHSIVVRMLHSTRRSGLLINPYFTSVGIGRAPYWFVEPDTSIWCALFTS
jgi:uncharacterized protein YkwD